MRWHVSIVPATWEAEAGELLEPGRWRLQGAEIVPLHSSLGDRARLHLKKNKKKKVKKIMDQMTSAGKGTQKLEPMSTAAGNVKCYSR